MDTVAQVVGIWVFTREERGVNFRSWQSL